MAARGIKDVGYRPKVGEKLIIVTPSHRNGVPEKVAVGTVVKVGTKLAHIRIGEENDRGWNPPRKFRIESQHTEDATNYNSWYLTEDQAEWQKKSDEATATFRKYYVDISWRSTIRDPEKYVRVAEAIREIMGADPEEDQGR